MKGAADDFLVTYPTDHTISSQAAFGVGDASSKNFQLTRPIGGGIDIIQNLNGNPNIYKAGVLQNPASYSISSTGLVVFGTAPGSGANLTWTGSFYFRVHFVDDSLDLQMIGPNVWVIASLKWESIIL
jgi:hypothetical protein